MLKKLAILALLLFVFCVQAYPQPHKAQERGSSQQPAAPTPSAPVQQTGSPKLQTEQEKHVDADVRVIETPAKDRYDKAGFWVNLGLATVGFLGIGIGACTLWLIKAQVIEMRRQLRLTIDKERARVEIKTVGLTLEHDDAEFWNLKAGIELRNVGMGRAYVRAGAGDLMVADEAEPEHWNTLDVVNGFIDPTGDPHMESFYFFQTEGLDLLKYSQMICDGSLQLRIAGFVEYETVGTRFHRDFYYEWIGHDNPLNIGAALTFSQEFKPSTDKERVSYGFWSQPWFEKNKNEEYEIDTPKQANKKLRPNWVKKLFQRPSPN